MILFPSIRGFLPQSLGFCTAGFGCEYSKSEKFVNNFVYTLQAAVIFGNSVRILCLYLSPSKVFLVELCNDGFDVLDPR